MDYPTYEAIDIAKTAREHIYAIQFVLSLVAIFLALIPPIPTQWKWIWLRVLTITIVLWVTMMEFRFMYEVPWNRIVMDLQKRNPGYDGVGGNAVLLLFGWIIPFFQSLFTLLVSRFILLHIRKKKQLKEKEVDRIIDEALSLLQSPEYAKRLHQAIQNVENTKGKKQIRSED